MEHIIDEINPEDVKSRLQKGEQLKLVDVREPDEIAQGMIPTAKHIRLAEIPERFGELDPSQEWVVVCRSGKRSAQAWEFLKAQGYEKVKSMRGGMLAWEGDVETPKE